MGITCEMHITEEERARGCSDSKKVKERTHMRG